MSDPTGAYTEFLSSLGFILVELFEDSGKVIGGFFIPGGGTENTVPIDGTWDDTTNTITFSAPSSPAGITDLNFSGGSFLDSSGNVTALGGTWTGSQQLHNAPPPEVAVREGRAKIEKFHPIQPPPIWFVSGPWLAAFRQNIIQ